MALSLADFSKFIKTSFKHGSLIIAIFLPIMILLRIVNFVSHDFMYLINSVIIAIELGLAFFRLFLNEYLKARVMVNEVSQNIKSGNLSQAKAIIKDNIQESIEIAKETTKEIIETIRKPKEQPKETIITSEVINTEVEKEKITFP